jgi:predicted kinase
MIILLQGPPGSGKSTLGKSLSAKLNALFLSKDDLKEVLFDSLDVGGPEWSKKLGIASNSRCSEP